MDKVELIKKLKECNSSDPEEAHLKADKLLIDFIDDEEITKLFNSIYKWYA